MRVFYFGYDFFVDCLEKLIRHPMIEICRIFTFPSDGIIDFNDHVYSIANKYNIPISEKRTSAKELTELMIREKCDLIISAGYSYKIKHNLGNVKSINIHPTLLPVGRGPWPTPYIFLKGIKTTGVTIHKIIDEIDAGDILLQKKIIVKEDDDIYSLERKYKKFASEMIIECIENIDVLWDNATPQIGGEYWPMPDKSLMTISPDMDEEQVDLIKRAFNKEVIIYL